MPDVMTTNVQALVKPRNQGTNKEEKLALTANAFSLLCHLKPDLIIIDEGHHFPAGSWELISAATMEVNPACKFVLLTATPKRGDGAQYNLVRVAQPEDCFFYLYSRKDAIREKFIKEIIYHQIPPRRTIQFDAPQDDAQSNLMNPKTKHKKRGGTDLLCRYEQESYLIQMIDPAVECLLGLREACGNLPIRMLVNARTNKAAQDLAEWFNKRSIDKGWHLNKGWHLHAADITGRTNQSNENTLFNFACRVEDVRKPLVMVDVAIQNQMLGEGYDNPWIAVTVFVRPAKSVGHLSQTHGRAIRHPGELINHKRFTRALESHLFYPNEIDARTKKNEVHAVVDEYKRYVDESTESL